MDETTLLSLPLRLPQPGIPSAFASPFFFFFAEGQVINIECRAWAKNIKHNMVRAEREGSVKYAIMVD